MSVVVGAWARMGNYQQGLWQTHGVLPLPLNHAAVAASRDYLYIVNGRSSIPNLNTGIQGFWKYNTLSGLVTVLAMSAVTARFGMWGATYGSDLFFGGGWQGASAGNKYDTYQYVPSTNTWTVKATAPTTVRGVPATTVTVGNKILVWGGYRYDTNVAGASGTLNWFMPGANQWVAISTTVTDSVLGMITFGGVAAPYANAALFMNDTGNTRMYQPDSGLVTVLATRPAGLQIGRWPVGGQTPDGLIAAGGASSYFRFSTSGALLNAVATDAAYSGTARYNYANNAWSAALDTMAAGVGQAGFVVHDSKLYAIGGITTSRTTVPTIQRYTI